MKEEKLQEKKTIMGRSFYITALFGCILAYRCAESHWYGERLLSTWGALKPKMAEEGNRIALLHEVQEMEGKKISHDNERGLHRRRKRKERRHSAWTTTRKPLTAMSGLRGGGGDEFENLDVEMMQQNAVDEKVRSHANIISLV